MKMLKNVALSCRWLLLVALIVVGTLQAQALTADEILAKGKSKLTSATSISASFTMKLNGQSLSGTILSKGSKFALISGVSSNWYNGKDLYTYNPSSNETTVFRPTAAELLEVNPLLYINSASNYNVKATKAKVAGEETVVLIPKKTGTGVKNVSVTFDSKTFLPKLIRIVTSSGSTVEVSVSNIKLNGSVSDSSFEYPKSKYPKVKINDMR